MKKISKLLLTVLLMLSLVLLTACGDENKKDGKDDNGINSPSNGDNNGGGVEGPIIDA